MNKPAIEIHYFSVFFVGQLRAGADYRSALAGLEERFSLSSRTINRLMSSGGSTIKANLSSARAKALVKTLWQLGWHAQIIRDEDIIFSTLTGKLKGRDRRSLERITQVESLAFPKGWSAFDSLNPSASIQAGNPEKKSFCIVIAQEKSAVGDKVTLCHYSRAITASAVKTAERATLITSSRPMFTESSGLTVSISEYVSHNASGIGLQYLIAVFEGREKFYSVYCWTPHTDYARVKDQFLSIIDSFCLLDQPARARAGSGVAAKPQLLAATPC